MLGYPKNLPKQTYYVLKIDFRQLIYTLLACTLLTLNQKISSSRCQPC